MRILVTGAAGFLGSHLAENLLKMNHEVICLDNYYTGREKNYEHLISYKGFSSIVHDIEKPIDLKIDGIFNLACPASPIMYQQNPVQTLRTNVLGAMNMLDLAKSNNARILQASTSEVYGDPAVSPQPESYWGNVNPIGIRSCYDEGKRAAETLFFDYYRQYNTDIRVARIFNTYGPRMLVSDGRVVSNFIVQALTDQKLTVYGNGSQTRSLCYVDDLISGLIQLFFTEDVFEPVNLGNPNPLTMLELAGEIITMTNSKSEIEFLPLPLDDPLTREPVITKAGLLFGWEPQIERNDGLAKTIEFFKTELMSLKLDYRP